MLVGQPASLRPLLRRGLHVFLCKQKPSRMLIGGFQDRRGHPMGFFRGRITDEGCLTLSLCGLLGDVCTEGPTACDPALVGPEARDLTLGEPLE